MKKVLFVISTLNTGGAQRAFSNIIMALPEDYEINILLNDSENIVYPYRGEIIDLGLKPQKNKMRLSYQIKVFLKRYFALRKLKKNGNYIACVSALESANFVNVLTGNKYCKSILSVRVFREKGEASAYSPIMLKIITSVMKIFYNHADKVVAVSEGIRKNLIDEYKLKENKVCTIYNGYDISKIIADASLPLPDDIKVDLSGRVIVASGRLAEQKGFEHLIKSFSNIAKDFRDVKLVILGEGELRDKFEKIICEYNLEGRVFLPGFVKNPFSVIAKCDIFVLSSLHEGYPNVLAEAIICGVPCISTDCRTGPREILANGEKNQSTATFELAEYGILCPSFLEDRNKGELAMEQALRELLSNDSLYQHYKEQCEKKRTEMEMKNIVKQWMHVIDLNE